MNLYRYTYGRIEWISIHLLEILKGQPITLIQVVSTSEFHEYWWTLCLNNHSFCLLQGSEASKVDVPYFLQMSKIISKPRFFCTGGRSKKNSNSELIFDMLKNPNFSVLAEVKVVPAKFLNFGFYFKASFILLFHLINLEKCCRSWVQINGTPCIKGNIVFKN